MSKTYEFLKECAVFYVLTLKNDKPQGRPFGAIMENDNKLYISTGSTKEVYNQMIKYPSIQIIALKSSTREWLRLNGIVKESKEINLKEKMLEKCPILKEDFDLAEAKDFRLFEISTVESFLNTNTEVIELT